MAQRRLAGGVVLAGVAALAHDAFDVLAHHVGGAVVDRAGLGVALHHAGQARRWKELLDVAEPIDAQVLDLVAEAVVLGEATALVLGELMKRLGDSAGRFIGGIIDAAGQGDAERGRQGPRQEGAMGGGEGGHLRSSV